MQEKINENHAQKSPPHTWISGSLLRTWERPRCMSGSDERSLDWERVFVLRKIGKRRLLVRREVQKEVSEEAEVGETDQTKFRCQFIYLFINC